MKAQVVLTSVESKSLIAKAVVKMEEIQKALQNGLIVIHPSSSTFFVMEELTGERPDKSLWMCGVIRPKGLCISKEMVDIQRISSGKPRDPGNANYYWVIKNGSQENKSKNITLYDLLKQMGPEDVYIKGCNAIDIEGNAAILFASKGAGTIGKVLQEQRKKKFKIILPVGLEKLIPISCMQAAKAASREGNVFSTGQSCGVLPVRGKTITEIDAINILFGITATPIAAGGLNGAEGAVVLALSGEGARIQEAVSLVINLKRKGPSLPDIIYPKCLDCPNERCHYYGRKDTYLNYRFGNPGN